MQKKILITDPIETSCIDILQSAGFEVSHRPGLKENEIISSILTSFTPIFCAAS